MEVKSSVSHRRWQERMDGRQSAIALEMTQKHGLSDIIARVLAGRGVPAADSEQFLDPTIRNLMPDPAAITDLEKAAARIVTAIENGEKVAIFGDYDVDGAASSALLWRFFHHFGINAEIYIPDRIFEGYGPNAQALTQLAKSATLIVTVDCGTNSTIAFAEADLGKTQIVVLDHHQIGGPLPDVAAVVNPNRDDDLSGLGHLCAAGVVFMTLVGASRQMRLAGRTNLPDLMSLLDLVALATVCDVVPLRDLNRAFVVKGLLIARQQKNPGIAALARIARLAEPFAPYHFGFIIGPRINAGGRIGDASLGAKLLTCDNQEEADALAAQLDDLNKQRQAAEAVMVEEATAAMAVEMESPNSPSVLVAAGDNWHAGIVGLIAARLKEAYARPAFAIHFDRNGKGTGSGRSIPGFDIGRLVRAAVDEGILVKGGGHAMAAGITVEMDQIGKLRAFFEARAASQIAKLVEGDILEIDAALSSGGATLELIAELEKAGPFGAGHAQPVFAFPNHVIEFAKPVGQSHLKVTIKALGSRPLEAIAFRAMDKPLGIAIMNNIGQSMHLAGTLSANYWNGRSAPQLRIIDATTIS